MWSPKGLVHNLLMQFYNLLMQFYNLLMQFLCSFSLWGAKKWKFSKLVRHVKHVLGRIHVFFTQFGYWAHGGEGGGSPKASIHNLLMQLFTLGSSKIEVFETCFFDILTT